MKANLFLSVPKLAAIDENELENNASTLTIQNVLHNANIKRRKAKRKLFISTRNQTVRLIFARKHENCDFSFWKNVLFIDECKFNIVAFHRKPYVWRKPSEELHTKKFLLFI